jgi:hypothetical protein
MGATTKYKFDWPLCSISQKHVKQAWFLRDSVIHFNIAMSLNLLSPDSFIGETCLYNVVTSV